MANPKEADGAVSNIDFPSSIFLPFDIYAEYLWTWRLCPSNESMRLGGYLHEIKVVL
jgi:hypothetical protein